MCGYRCTNGVQEISANTSAECKSQGTRHRSTCKSHMFEQSHVKLEVGMLLHQRIVAFAMPPQSKQQQQARPSES